jgi:hypothetical protein
MRKIAPNRELAEAELAKFGKSGGPIRSAVVLSGGGITPSFSIPQHRNTAAPPPVGLIRLRD